MNNLRNFAVIFAVSFIVLGIVALIACGYVADTVCAIFTDKGTDLDMLLQGNTSETTGIGSEGEDDRLTRNLNGDSFTWVMIVADYRPDVIKNYYPMTPDAVEDMDDDFGLLGEEYVRVKATSIVVVRADVKTREYVIMAIPSATRVDTPFGSSPIGDVYGMSGPEALVAEVSSLTGLHVDYFTVLNSEDLPSVSSTLGAIECNIPVDIAFDGQYYVTAPVTESADTGTGKAEADNDEDRENDGDDETDEPTTTYTVELERSGSVKLTKKQLMAALLFMDDTDGFDDEMLILQSFAHGVMYNLAGKSDGDLSSALSVFIDKFAHTNVTREALLDHAEVIRGYRWFKTQTMVYPGRYISGRAGRAGYYNPDTDAAISFFANYR